MPEQTETQDNVDRLLSHLKKDSLAAQLVQAHHTSNTGDPMESMKTVIRKRLQQLRKKLDNT